MGVTTFTMEGKARFSLGLLQNVWRSVTRDVRATTTTMQGRGRSTKVGNAVKFASEMSDCECRWLWAGDTT